ncbi:MAG: class I SAM-dependent methyltransferase [Oceanospirillaceae bacterium]|nr:class I SAM-dependent methyltransferase [Oceanospirillaceae bacterium]
MFEEKFQNESFDVIFAFNMLHTLPNPQNITHRINDLLKPDGPFSMMLVVAILLCVISNVLGHIL